MKLTRFHNFSFLLLALVILVIPEILKVYFIMPFPGSQHQNNVELAYSINHLIWISRIAGGALLLFAIIGIFTQPKLWKKVVAGFLVVLAAGIVYLTTFVMLADKMFYQPETKLMKTITENKIADERSVIGVEINGQASAYPIYLIGYHHQVRDTVGGAPVMVTYCAVCRTGRVYKPGLNGKPETFRLVGMDQFNAMFEDATTKSWWRQATGECCAGPLKGQQLEEIASQQMTLGSWKALHPQTLIMQPDPKFIREYNELKGYDIGAIKGGLVGTDTASLQRKSWVVGIIADGAEKIYDWNLLKQKGFISDVVGHEPVVLVMEADGLSFHAFSRKVNDSVVELFYNSEKHLLVDKATAPYAWRTPATEQIKDIAAVWNLEGKGVLEGLNVPNLKPVKAYQEFYHSFKSFHPKALVYK